MAKPLKIVLSLFAALLLLVVGAVVALPLLIDPNDYRGQIAEQVEKATGRSFSIGEIDLKVFPWVRLRVSDAELGNAEGFGEAPFARVGTVDVGVHLLPLLFSRQLEVSTLTLSDLEANLARLADGRSNWEDLGGAGPETDAPADDAPPSGEGFSLQGVDIAGVLIERATIRYDDAQAGQQVTLENFGLKTGRLVPGKPVDLSSQLALQLAEPAVRLDVTLAGRVDSDSAFERIELQKLSLDVLVAGKALVDGQDVTARARLNADAKVDLAAGVAELGALLLELETGGRDLPNGLGATAALKLSGQPSYALDTQRLAWPDFVLDYDVSHPEGAAKGRLTAAVTADGAVPSAALERLAVDGQLRAPQLAAPSNLKLRTAVNWNGQAGTAELRDLVLETLGLTLRGQINASALNSETPRARGRIELAPFSPKALAQALKIELPATSDPQVLTQARLSTDLEGSPKAAALRNLDLQLDDTRVRGRVEVRDFATQALAFELDVDAIDVDRYLPPESGEAAPTPPPGQQIALNEIQLPTEVLDSLNADGTLKVGRLKVSGLTLTEAQVRLSGAAGQPKRQQVSAKLYGGSVQLDHRYTPGATPGYALKTTLDSFSAAPFLKDFLGEDYVSGLARLSLDLTSAGGTVGALRQALNGQLGFEVRDGAVRGFNLAQVLRRAEAALTGNLAGARADAATTEKTDFATLGATATIVNGVLKTDNLNAASPLFRFNGSGSVDLARETLDFIARPTVVQTLTGQDGKALEALRGLTIPIQLTGSLFEPRIRIDVQEALKNKVFDSARERLQGEQDQLRQRAADEQEELKARAKAEEDRLKSRAEQEIEERLGPGGVDALRGLFGRPPRATPTPEPSPAAEAPPAAEDPT